MQETKPVIEKTAIGVKGFLLITNSDITELARKIGYRREWVSLVIHGHRKGRKIWPRIAEILDIEFKAAA